MYPLRLIAYALIISAVLISTVSAAPGITAQVGETWIKWTWSANQTPVNVYIDGTGILTNSTINYYYLTGLKPLERHNIQTYNSSNTSELWQSSTVNTLQSTGIIFILIGIELVGLIVLLAIKRDDQIKIVMVGAGIIILSLFTAMQASGLPNGLPQLPYIWAIMAAAYTGYALWTTARGSLAWY